jgi:nucleotidyltransferase-like protein
VVADTVRPRLVWEVPYYPAYHLPLEDVRTDLLVPTATVSHSPSRGDARHATQPCRMRSINRLLPRLRRSLANEARGALDRSMTPQVRLVGTGCGWMPGGLWGQAADDLRTRPTKAWTARS